MATIAPVSPGISCFLGVNVSSSEATLRRLLSKGVRYLAFNDSINTNISHFLRLSPFNVAFTRLMNSFKYCVGGEGVFKPLTQWLFVGISSV